MARPRLTDADTMKGITTPAKAAPKPIATPANVPYNPLSGMTALVPTVEIAPGLSVPTPSPTIQQVGGAVTGATGPTGSTGATGGTPSGKFETNRVQNADGTITIIYSDGSYQVIGGITPTSTGSTTAQNAFDAFYQAFAAVGMGDIANELLTLSKSPDAPTTTAGYYRAMQQLPIYVERYGAINTARRAKGLTDLTESQTNTATENIKNGLRAAGAPAGFYDQPEDIRNFIINDKSAREVTDIFNAYKDLAKIQDPNIISSLKSNYNIDLGGVAAMLMDPTKAQPILNSLTQYGTVPAAAATAGIQDIQGATQAAQQLGAGTLSYAKQAQAFGQAQQTSQQLLPLEQRYSQMGVGYNLESGLQEALGGPQAVQAQLARQKLTTQELSQFGGSAGADTRAQSLGIGTAQGIS